MKDSKDIVCCVVDYGCTGISLAETLSKSFKKVYFHSPIDDEFRNVKATCQGDGIEGVERCDDFLDPAIFDEVSLYCFPDIGWGGTQKFLRRAGKAVWGSMGADDFELYRTRFLDLLKKMDLPVIPSVRIKGITNLELYLKENENKWVKVNCYRDNMETWHHVDWAHSHLYLDELAVEFGGLKDEVVFVVQDDLDTDIEIGYDGWTIDGKFPSAVFSGYEKKNELYLGSQLEYDKLPDAIKEVNAAMSPFLKEWGYRNFIATEIRVKDDVPYFIDPTMRMPGQTGEQLLETCTNLADVIWYGANGEVIEPEYAALFSAEATLHYTASNTEWRALRVPPDIKQWVKLYHYCELDGMCHFPPAKNDELGIVLGMGDTIEAAIDHLRENLDELGDEPVKTNLSGFKDLLESIEEAEKEGIDFTNQQIPDPSTVLE